MFPVRFFCNQFFAPRYFAKVSALIVQTAESLHYVLPESRCHYSIDDGRLHYGLPESRLHYDLAKDN